MQYTLRFSLIVFRLQVFLSILPGWRPLGLLFPIFNHQGFFNVHTCTRDLRVYRPSPIGLGTDPACRHLGESHMRSCEYNQFHMIGVYRHLCYHDDRLNDVFTRTKYFRPSRDSFPRPAPPCLGLAVRRFNHSASMTQQKSQPQGTREYLHNMLAYQDSS